MRIEHCGTSESSLCKDTLDSERTKTGFGVALASCLIFGLLGLFSATTASAGFSVCEDSDGDGWGWDGEKSCRMDGFASQHTAEVVQAVFCSDPDGDGWGWTGTESCRVNSTSTFDGLPGSSSQAAPVDNNSGSSEETNETVAQDVSGNGTTPFDGMSSDASPTLSGVATSEGQIYASQNGSEVTIEGELPDGTSYVSVVNLDTGEIEATGPDGTELTAEVVPDADLMGGSTVIVYENGVEIDRIYNSGQSPYIDPDNDPNDCPYGCSSTPSNPSDSDNGGSDDGDDDSEDDADSEDNGSSDDGGSDDGGSDDGGWGSDGSDSGFYD